MGNTVLQAFIFCDGNFLGTEMVLGDRVEIGRDPSCALQLEDDLISRRHVAVTVVGNQLYVEDMQSANGTQVNGEALTGPRPLSARDDISIGHHVVKFKMVNSAPARPAPAPLPPPGSDATAVYNYSPEQILGSAQDPAAPQPPPQAAPPVASPPANPMAHQGSPQQLSDVTVQVAQPPRDPWRDLSSSGGLSNPGSPVPVATPGAPGLGSPNMPGPSTPGPSTPGTGLADELFADIPGIAPAAPAPTPPPDPFAPSYAQSPQNNIQSPPNYAQAPSMPSAVDDLGGAAAEVAASFSLDPQATREASTAAPSLDPGVPEPTRPVSADPYAPAGMAGQPSVIPNLDPFQGVASALEPPPEMEGLVDPGLVDPGLVDAGLRTPGLADRGLADSGLADPGLADPGLDPRLVDPGLDALPEPSGKKKKKKKKEKKGKKAKKASQKGETSPQAAVDLGPAEPEPALPYVPPDPNADEDYDPDDEPAPFSMVENLLRERFKDGHVKQVRRPVLEVIHYKDNVVKELVALGSGQFYVVGQKLKKSEAQRIGIPANYKLARLRKNGEADLAVQQGFQGKVQQNGGSRSIHDAAEWKGESGVLRLKAGDLASLQIGSENYFLRFAFPPSLQTTITKPSKPTVEQRKERRWTFASFGTSASVHFLVLLVMFVIGLLKPAQLVTQLDEDRFVQVEMEELELEKPPEEEPPEEPEEATPEEIPDEKPQKQPPRSKLSHPSGKTKKPGILAALGKIPKRSGAAGSQTLTAAVSNLDAVKVPGGGASYKVSGLIGKGPTNRVRIGGSGGGVSTKGLASILREGGGGPGTLSKLKRGKVRGRLVKASRGSKLKGSGYLDRSEIQKVVNKGLGQIQFCYEKELLKNQSLSGKVVFEWTISTSGKVSIVKTKTATLRSPKATQCMINSIKRWKFPKPRGNGTVIVTYPFIFNAMGF